jgi:hypothetical protein
MCIVRCSETVTGKHEPSVVLKDNDLKHKMKLSRASALKLLEQLQKDADLLCDQIGVMDYSLLGYTLPNVDLCVS